MNQPVSNLSDKTVDEAIAWLIRTEISDDADKSSADFEQWLQQSPEHELAWERVKGLHSAFTSLPSKPITQTFDSLNRHSNSTGISRRQALKILSVTGLMLSTGWMTKTHTPWQRLISDHSTKIGQQDELQLSDNLNVFMNTDSALSVDLAGNRRQLILRRGEVQIIAATENKGRPLLVKTPVGRISALDTRFTLRLNPKRAKVSVHEGQLLLLNRSGEKKRLNSGDSFWLSDSNIKLAKPSVISADAWVTGAISGENIPLGELLDELSRYRLGVIEYAPELKYRLVSGIFQLKDTDTTLNFLAQVQPVKVEYRTPYWVVVQPA